MATKETVKDASEHEPIIELIMDDFNGCVEVLYPYHQVAIKWTGQVGT